MKRVLVKVCGITDGHDALECALLGVDALGFHFFPDSPRYIAPAEARRIVERLPAFVTRVGVFVDEEPARIAQIARQVGLTAVQLHGDESPEACEALAPVVWYKALRASGAFRPEALADYACTTYLLDAFKPDWGGGDVFDWGRARKLQLHGRIIASGGLTPDNVEAVVALADPYGVDVSSGVEAVLGRKDVDRVEQFLDAVRRGERRLDDGVRA